MSGLAPQTWWSPLGEAAPVCPESLGNAALWLGVSSTLSRMDFLVLKMCCS